MFGESRYKPRHNTHQGQFAKKREKERRWEESVESIAATDKVRCETTLAERMREKAMLGIFCVGSCGAVGQSTRKTNRCRLDAEALELLHMLQ